MENVISVIIPVYNVQAYLPACLDSVLSQDHRELEIILINDGSKDDSGKICDDYAAKDSRIRVIHQANAGSGAAKNAGLRMATGEYLAFLDSDDTLEPGAYRHMMSLMKQYDADVVQCLLRFVYKDHTEVQRMTEGRQHFSVLEYLERFPWDWTCALMTEKLFKRSLFDGIFFEEGNIIDDEYFTYQGIMNAKKILRDDCVVYNYRQRRSSVMNASGGGERILMNRMDYLDKRRRMVASRYPELKAHFNREYLESLVHLIKNPYNTEKTIRLIKEKIKNYFQEQDWNAPGIGFLPKLLYTYFAGTNVLLQRRKKPPEPAGLDVFYP